MIDAFTFSKEDRGLHRGGTGEGKMRLSRSNFKSIHPAPLPFPRASYARVSLAGFDVIIAKRGEILSPGLDILSYRFPLATKIV